MTNVGHIYQVCWSLSLVRIISIRFRTVNYRYCYLINVRLSIRLQNCLFYMSSLSKAILSPLVGITCLLVVCRCKNILMTVHQHWFAGRFYFE